MQTYDKVFCLCGSLLAPLAKYRDKKTARGDGAVLYEVVGD